MVESKFNYKVGDVVRVIGRSGSWRIISIDLVDEGKFLMLRNVTNKGRLIRVVETKVF